MNAREYLSQAYRLDDRIKSKRDQIQYLNDLAHQLHLCYDWYAQSPRQHHLPHGRCCL